MHRSDDYGHSLISSESLMPFSPAHSGPGKSNATFAPSTASPVSLEQPFVPLSTEILSASPPATPDLAPGQVGPLRNMKMLTLTLSNLFCLACIFFAAYVWSNRGHNHVFTSRITKRYSKRTPAKKQ